MDQLLGMGFSEAQCTKGLAEAGNVDGAVSYIFANADKPPAFWAPAPEPAAVAGASGAATARATAPAAGGVGAETIAKELAGVLSELRPATNVAKEALTDPGFVAGLIGEAAGVDVERVVQTITGAPSPKRFAGVGPTPAAIADQAVEFFTSALEARWGEYVGTLNEREVALVAADARRIARRGSATDASALVAKSAALAALPSQGAPRTLKECLATEGGAVLAREIILLDGSSLPSSAHRQLLPEPEPAADADAIAAKKKKADKHRPAPEPQGTLEIEVNGQPLAIPFSVAAFGACRSALADQVLVQTEPPLADADLTNAEGMSGSVAVCMRGGVPFIDKARRAQAAGAVALIVVNSSGESEPEPDSLFAMGCADEAEDPITIPVVGIGAAHGERLLSAGITSLKYDWNPHELVLLNDCFTVSSYDGGEETPETAVSNLLVPKLRPFHCSKPGVGHTLELKCDDPLVVITHIVVHAAASCSAPLSQGEVWVTSAAFADGPEPVCVDGVCRLPSAGGAGSDALTRLPFEISKKTMQYVYPLPQPVGGGVSVGLTWLSTFHDENPNVDVGMVVLVGHKDGTETAAALSAAAAADGGIGPVPRDLKVTDLLRHVQRKKWMPLESDRDILTGYLHKIGVPRSYAFHDILAFEDWAVEMVPGPALALVLLFPVTKETEAARKAEQEVIDASGQTLPEGVPLLHIQQNIGNACGTIGLLHAACHASLGGDLDAAIPPESWLGKFTAKAAGLDAEAAGQVLEDDIEIEDAHAAAEAASHDAAARTQDVRNHFTAIVHRDGKLWELDGRKKVPIQLGATTVGSFLKDALTQVQLRFVQVCEPGSQFVLFALAPVAQGGAEGGGGGVAPPMEVELDPADVAELVMISQQPEEVVREAMKAAGGNKDAAMARLFG